MLLLIQLFFRVLFPYSSLLLASSFLARAVVQAVCSGCSCWLRLTL